MRQEIEEYGLAWHPEQGGRLQFRIKGQTAWVAPIMVPADQLAGIAAILSENPVYVEDDRWIHTGPEAPGN